MIDVNPLANLPRIPEPAVIVLPNGLIPNVKKRAGKTMKNKAKNVAGLKKVPVAERITKTKAPKAAKSKARPDIQMPIAKDKLYKAQVVARMLLTYNDGRTEQVNIVRIPNHKQFVQNNRAASIAMEGYMMQEVQMDNDSEPNALYQWFYEVAAELDAKDAAKKNLEADNMEKLAKWLQASKDAQTLGAVMGKDILKHTKDNISSLKVEFDPDFLEDVNAELAAADAARIAEKNADMHALAQMGMAKSNAIAAQKATFERKMRELARKNASAATQGWEDFAKRRAAQAKADAAQARKIQAATRKAAHAAAFDGLLVAHANTIRNAYLKTWRRSK